MSNQVLQTKLNQLLACPTDEVLTFICTSETEACCLFFSSAENHWQQGCKLLVKSINAIHSQLSSPATKNDLQYLPAPIFGGILWYYYQSVPNKKDGLILLKEYFPIVLAYHNHLYSNYDYNETGLIHKNNIVDPFFQGILSWSNQALIKIGEKLAEDITDLVLWNELTTFSCQELMWNNDEFFFYQLINGQIQDEANDAQTCYLPLIGNILTQEEAENMLCLMQTKGYPVDESEKSTTFFSNELLTVCDSILLLLGLQNYEMDKAIDCLRTDTIKRLKNQKTDWKSVAILTLLEGQLLH